jgi:hypothetical protein
MCFFSGVGLMRVRGHGGSDDSDERGAKKLICPVCGKQNPFVYLSVGTEVHNIDLWIDDEVLDTGFLMDFVYCKKCEKIVFPIYTDEISYAEEIIEKKYNYVFVSIDDVPELVKSLLVALFEEVKRFSRLTEQYYGDFVDMFQKDWDRIFGQTNQNIPRVSVGDDVFHVFLSNGSVHIANNDGETRVMVVYEKSVKDTLEELKKPEVVKLIEETLSKLKGENDRLEMHIAVEKMVE